MTTKCDSFLIVYPAVSLPSLPSVWLLECAIFGSDPPPRVGQGSRGHPSIYHPTAGV